MDRRKFLTWLRLAPLTLAIVKFFPKITSRLWVKPTGPTTVSTSWQPRMHYRVGDVIFINGEKRTVTAVYSPAMCEPHSECLTGITGGLR